MLDLFISAGEVSGDMHAADLMRELNQRDGFSFLGLGGKKMFEAGLKSIVAEDFSVTSTVGFVESTQFIGGKIRALKLSLRVIRERQIKWVILVDNQGFNIPFAKKLKRLDVKVIYYLPPRVSIWGRGNAKKLAKITDLLIPFLPRDEAIYQNAGCEVFFAGNPLLDRVFAVKDKESARQELDLEQDKPVISVFPGSRDQEVRTLTPVFAKVAGYLVREKNCTILLPISHPTYEDEIKKNFGLEVPDQSIRYLKKDPLLAMSAADVNLMASGTATLESVLLKRPPVICYQISALSFWIGKMLVKLQMFGLPNLILERKVFPEHIRGSFREDFLTNSVLKFLNANASEKEQLNLVYDEIRKKLGKLPVAEKVAEKVLEKINGTYPRN